MPLYEFRCPNGHDFEKFYRSIGTSSSEAECPVCGAVAQRLMSAAGLVFKGSGFYITDYGKDGKKAEREAATAQKGKADAAESKTAESSKQASDSKPAESVSSEKPKSESTAKAEPASKPAPSTPSSTDSTSK